MEEYIGGCWGWVVQISFGSFGELPLSGEYVKVPYEETMMAPTCIDVGHQR